MEHLSDFVSQFFRGLGSRVMEVAGNETAKHDSICCPFPRIQIYRKSLQKAGKIHPALRGSCIEMLQNLWADVHATWQHVNIHINIYTHTCKYIYMRVLYVYVHIEVEDDGALFVLGSAVMRGNHSVPARVDFMRSFGGPGQTNLSTKCNIIIVTYH